VAQLKHPKPNRYQDIKGLAASEKRRLKTLVALDPDADPFVADSPSRLLAARWFAKLWKVLDLKPGVHLKKIHYLLVSQPTRVVMPDGRPYENNVRCSHVLYNAGRDARYNELIPEYAIIDARSADPEINLSEDEDSPAEIATIEGSIRAPDMLALLEIELSLPEIMLFRPVINQRYHVEIWIEKSTMADILTPLGAKYGVNIITGTGEMSATNCEDLIKRACASGRPVRILYLSDLDPGGVSFPVAVARKAEFISRKLDLDLQVRRIVVTVDQCDSLGLPRIEIKETEARREKFEERFGKGGCELDAIQAIHPGELHDILVAEIERYHDGELENNIEAICEEAVGKAADVTGDVHIRYSDEIEELETERDSINAETAEFIARWKQRSEALLTKAKPLFSRMEQELANEAPDADEFDWPEPDAGDDDDDPMYDSTRDYLSQIDAYREHQGKGHEITELRFAHPLTCEVCGNAYTAVRSSSKTCGDECRRKRWEAENPTYHKDRHVARRAALRKSS
jgi:hypothetical protein